MKIDCSKVIFTDESRVTFDGPDRWILSNLDMSVAKRRQQRGSSFIIQAGIVDQTIIGPFKVDEGVKLNSDNYCDFIKKIFFAWYKSQFHSFKVKCVFMHDNAPSHVSKLAHVLFEHKGFTGEKIMEWPSSLDLNPIYDQLWR